MNSKWVIVYNISEKYTIRNVEMVLHCWQVKLCDGFFVLQVRNYNIFGTLLNLFLWIRFPLAYTSWPRWASILYYRSDDTPIVVKQFIFLNTCPLQACEKIKPFECFSMNFVNMWSPFKVTRQYIPKCLEMVTLSISRSLIFKGELNGGTFFKTDDHFLGFLSIDLHVVVIWQYCQCPPVSGNLQDRRPPLCLYSSK